MDIQELAQLLGNIGEFVAAIAVVATLAYLAIQVRQNSKAVEAATSHSVTRSQNEMNIALATHPELSETLLAGHRDYESLSPEQRQRFNAYVLGILNTYEDLHLQYLKGFVQHDQWQNKLNFLREFFSNENMMRWWQKIGASRVSSQFREEIEKNLGN